MDSLRPAQSVFIGEKEVSVPNKPYIIAEAGGNHNGNLSQALKLVEIAADCGADAVKFQTYKAETLASKNSPSYWDLKKEPTAI